MAAESARHHVDLACPECGHIQSEPALVVSTMCRACGANFQVKDGKAISRAKPSTKFSTERLHHAHTDEPEAKPKSTSTSPFKRPDPPAPQPAGFFQKLFGKVPKPRHVICFDCGKEHIAAPTAQSSQCPYCGFYISLTDYTISERWNRRIQTRGNVVIQKGGSITGVPVTCHHLTVMGELAAAVECSGDFVIVSHGKIPGNVRCHTLKVQRGAKVEFLHAVHAQSVTIGGDVTGQIYCTGTVTLEKRAKLRGLVRAARLTVKQGAQHSGVIEIVQQTGESETPKNSA